jgi:hypothetical protein
VLVQQRFESKDVCDRHVVGWSAALDRMTKTTSGT